MVKKKEPVTEVHPQTVLKGATIRSRESKQDEIVTRVSVVLHLGNGMDEVYHDGDVVKLVPSETVEFPKELTGGE